MAAPPAARWPVGWRPLLALLPLLAVLLGGATARWSQAVVLILLGAALLIAPPRRRLGRTLDAVLGVLILLAFTAFLPARWFSFPPWRTAMTEDFGVTLPAILSPHPWLSAESTVLFLAGAGWFYLMATVRWTVEERVRAARVYAGGTILLAAIFVVFYKLNVVVPFWLNTRHFGPFPNRNQTADFLAIGALLVLGCAHASWRAGHRPAAVCWLVGWLVVAAAVFNNFSRAGIGILFAGSGIYLVIEAIRTARRRRPRREVKEGDPLPDRAIAISRWRRGALAVSLLLMLGSGFFLFGGDTLGRFQFDSVAGAESVVTDQFRAQIQRDAAHMTAVSPWCGVGLGNFAPTFAVSRHLSASPAWLIHPESDWLWMAVELGWLAPALTLTGLLLLARRVWPYRQGKDRPLRVAATMAVALFALHGFVDVSAHRLGTAFCGMFLLGLALPGEGPRHGDSAAEGGPGFPPISRGLARGFRAFGAVLVGVGLWWACEAAGWMTAPGELGVARLKALAAASGSVGDYAGAERAATQALAWAPLDWQLYFARATARVCLQGDLREALEDFRRARYLQPFAGDPCFTEASFWAAASESALSVSALVEACHREPERATRYISDVANIAAEGGPAFRERLLPALRRDPGLELSFLRSLDPPDMGPVIAAVTKDDPGLQVFSDKQKQAFFRFWQQGGDASALAAAMEAHPDWQPLGWRAWARACAGLNQWERACGIARHYATEPAIPPAPTDTGRSLTELQDDVRRSPKDPVAALHLYFAHLAAGDAGAALVTLHRIALEPGCPPYFHYLEACRAGELGHWNDGWNAWEKYLDETETDR